MKNLLKSLRDSSYRRQVRQLRDNIQAGYRVTLHRETGKVDGLVMNIRRYQHGPAEVYFQADDYSVAGWFSVENILPQQEAR